MHRFVIYSYIISRLSIVQLLHVPYETILIAMELFNESPTVDSTLRDRLWRLAAIHTSHSLLRGLSDYRVSKFDSG